MTFVPALLAVAAVTLLSGHVAPSVDDNNRYLKVTPLADGFRLAYTVFFGEVPGAAERRQLDANRDGRIDQAEADAFGHRLAAQVTDSLDLEVGGASQRVRWALVSVGLGSDRVAAGSFSIDMIAYVCAPGGPQKTLRLRDGFRIPKPGETEVKVEDSPGVTIHAARIGALDDPLRDYRFAGAPGPLTDDGLTVTWTPGPSAPAVPQDRCAGMASTSTRGPRGWLLLAAGGVIAATVLAFVAYRVVRRHRRRR